MSENKKPPKKPGGAPKASDQPKAPKQAAESAAVQAKSGDGKSVKGLRIGAWILWILALGCEVGAFFALSRVALNMKLIEQTGWKSSPEVWVLIGFLVVDFLLCVIAAQLWKKALRIRPSLSKSKFVRTLTHQWGVVMALVCLLPIGIFLLVKSKELNKQLKTVLLVLFAVLFLGASVLSVDFKQPSDEQVAALQQQAAAENTTGTVYWTRWGKSYHFDRNCPTLSRTIDENLFSGTLQDAFDANRWDPCDFCAGGGDVDTQPTDNQQ